MDRFLADYQIIKNNLLTQQPVPFPVKEADYSETALEEARRQIWKGNLLPVRSYLLKALSSEELSVQKDRWIQAKSVWIEYLTTIDSFSIAYTDALFLAQLADSLESPVKHLAYLSLARASFYVDDYINANFNVDKVLEYVKTSHNREIEGKAQLIAGIIARKYFWGSSGRSLPYYDKAIAAATASNDTVTLIRALMLKEADMGESRHIVEGLPYMEAATDLIIKGHYLKYTSNICESMFFPLAAAEQYYEATDMLLEALAYTQKSGMLLTETHMYLQLAELYGDREMYDSAVYYYNQCKNEGLLAPGIKTPQLQKADLYYAMGDYKQAAGLYNKGMNDYLNTFILQGQNSISRWEASMRTNEKEQLLKQEEENRQQLIWAGGGVVVLLLITLSALFWQRRLRKRLAHQNQLVSKQSQKLEQSLLEKEVLLKEIHHRVKNNLQVIDSLLYLHEDSMLLPSEEKETFQKARMHVHTIAMIHQNLYQQEQVSAVNIQTFVNNLFAQTERIFNKERKPVVFNNQIQDFYLDIDTAIPLGLILNEFITNSFKYAMPAVEMMQLHICIIPEGLPEHYRLQYNDNGPGIADGMNVPKTGSIGLPLIKQLSRQIGGNCTYTFRGGALFNIYFQTQKGRKQQD